MDRKPLDEETRCQEENVRFCRFSRSKVGSLSWKNIFKKFACNVDSLPTWTRTYFSTLPRAVIPIVERNYLTGTEKNLVQETKWRSNFHKAPVPLIIVHVLMWIVMFCSVFSICFSYFEWIVLWMKHRWEHKGYHDVVADNMKKTKVFFRIRKAARTLESSCLYYRCHAYSKRAAPTLSD